MAVGYQVLDIAANRLTLITSVVTSNFDNSKTVQLMINYGCSGGANNTWLASQLFPAASDLAANTPKPDNLVICTGNFPQQFPSWALTGGVAYPNTTAAADALNIKTYMLPNGNVRTECVSSGDSTLTCVYSTPGTAAPYPCQSGTCP